MDDPPVGAPAESLTPEDRAYDAALAALRRGEGFDVDALCREAGGGTHLRERLEALRHVARAPADEARPPFERLGDFRLLRRLGEGSMGVVWLAEQEGLKRPVALKMIRTERIGSRDAEARFEREAVALARLRHPNVVPVFAAGEAHGVRFLAMELIDGESLAERLSAAAARDERPDVPAVLRCVLDVARALAAAHEAGIVHRDVKPSNVLMGRDGRARLTDFGLALEVGAPALSRSEGFLGTPFYAAPEQVEGRREAIGPRSDVYSLGATLYEATTGVVPFPADSAEQALRAILHAELIPPRRRNAALSRDLETVIEKAMERDPARRYPSAAAFADDLEALLAVRPIAARPAALPRRLARKLRARPLLAAGIAAVLLLAVAVPIGIALRGHAEARAAMDAARSRLESLRGAREESSALERDIGPLRRDRHRRPLSLDEEKRLRHAETQRRVLEARRDEAFHAGLAILARADALGADASAVTDLRARLYLELWRERTGSGDRAGAAALVPRIVENDAAGAHRAELEGLATVIVLPDPADAEVFLFRYVEHAEVVTDGDQRLVPVPVGGASAIEPGSHVLRVARGAGDIRVGDLVIDVEGRPALGDGSMLRAAADAGPVRRLDRLRAIDGEAAGDPYTFWILSAARWDASGAPPATNRYTFERDAPGGGVETIDVDWPWDPGPPIEIVDARTLAESGDAAARVFRDGRIDDVRLPAGLVLRPTAAPAPLDKAARRDGPARLAAGSYLAIVRAEGRELQRVPFVLEAGEDVTLRPRLLAAGAVPQGFVHVPGGAARLGGDADVTSAREMREVEVQGFFIQEREVTFFEWWEFLRDPDVRREIDASAVPILFPRFPDNAATGGYLPRDARGEFRLPTAWAQWPVMGVSAPDADAYARWRTQRARAAGLSTTFRLPTAEEWEKAARGVDLRRYPFGDEFGQRFAKGALSRPIRTDTPFDVTPEPAISFPIDESPYGAFDMSGSQREWTSSIHSQSASEVLRELRSSSWNESEPQLGRTAYRFGTILVAAEAGFGLRLAADEAAP